jgi:hypothetical protein
MAATEKTTANPTATTNTIEATTFFCHIISHLYPLFFFVTAPVLLPICKKMSIKGKISVLNERLLVIPYR